MERSEIDSSAYEYEIYNKGDISNYWDKKILK